MTLSESQYQNILTRLTALELATNDIITAINSLVSVQQVNALTVELQTSIETLQIDVAALLDRIESLEEESFT